MAEATQKLPDHPITTDELRAMVGQPRWASEWYLVEQSTINDFARVTQDFAFIHIDPDAEAPFMTGGLEQRGPSALPVLLR